MGQGAQRLSRRWLMRWLAAAGLPVPGIRVPAAWAAGDIVSRSDRLIVSGRDSTPWHGAATGRLHVGGHVAAPLDLSLDDLRQLGSETVAAVLECAGSGRAGHARWNGVPLRVALDLAGIDDDAVAVAARGGDGHERAISLRDVARIRPLLAWAMDGAAPPASRGGPLRLIVPGWAAEASVKWLTGIEVTDRLPPITVPPDPLDRRLRPLREMPPRAVIVAPGHGEILRAGRITVRGYAWSGYAPVASVVLSVDGGGTWRETEIVERTGPHGWVRFAFSWDARPGPAAIAARATDAFGLTQPLRVPEPARGFVHNAVVTLPVTVAR